MIIPVLTVAIHRGAIVTAIADRIGFLGDRPDVVRRDLAFLVGVLSVPWPIPPLFLFDRRGAIRT